MKEYIFTKSRLGTNDIDKIPGKKGLLSAKGGVRDAGEGVATGFLDSIY